MMRVVLFLFALVAVSFCQGPPPSSCCAPPQMQGYVTGTSYEQEYAFSEYFFYDYTNQMARYDVVVIQGGGHQVVESTLVRPDLKAAFITNYGTNSCSYYNITNALPKICTPPNGDVYDFTLGVTLPCRSYFYQFGSQKIDYVVERDSCIPISGLFLSQRQSTDVEYEYFNVLPQILDPLVFEAPQGCTLITPPPASSE